MGGPSTASSYDPRAFFLKLFASVVDHVSLVAGIPAAKQFMVQSVAGALMPAALLVNSRSRPRSSGASIHGVHDYSSLAHRLETGPLRFARPSFQDRPTDSNIEARSGDSRFGARTVYACHAAGWKRQLADVTPVTINRAQGHSTKVFRFEILRFDLDSGLAIRV